MPERTAAINALTERLEDVGERMDALTTAVHQSRWQTTELRKQGRRVILALVAVVLVAVVSWNANRVKDNNDARDTRARRVSFCESLDDMGTVVKIGSNSWLDVIPTFARGNQEQVQAFADAVVAQTSANVDDGIWQVKARNKLPADCLLPPAPQEDIPVWLPVGVVVAAGAYGATVIRRRRQRTTEEVVL